MTKRWSTWTLLSALVVLSLPALAQSTQPNDRGPQGAYGQSGYGQSGYGQPGQGYGPNYIPEGTRFVVLLDDKLETSKLKDGKQFKAKMGEDLVAPNGEVIPRGKKLKGHVSSAGGGLHGRMLLAFDQIETRHGWVPVAATVTGVPGEHGVKTSNEGEIEKGGVNKRRAAEGVLAGAAVGAGTGAAAGGAHGAVIGAAAGAAVGGTAAILTDRNLTLNKGQQLELQLDRPLQVPSH